MSEPNELVVMRLNDMTRRHPKQVTMRCHKCNQKVGVYPSGQEALKKYPNMKVICIYCVNIKVFEDTAEPAGSMEQIRQESKDSYSVKRR